MDKVRIKLRGHVTVTSSKEGVVYDKTNTISPDALEIVANCLYQGDYRKQIDSIKAIGAFGESVRAIERMDYISSTNSIALIATFSEGDFTGEVTELKLISASYNNKEFAVRAGVSILKNSDTRLEVTWKIQIT